MMMIVENFTTLGFSQPERDASTLTYGNVADARGNAEDRDTFQPKG